MPCTTRTRTYMHVDLRQPSPGTYRLRSSTFQPWACAQSSKLVISCTVQTYTTTSRAGMHACPHCTAARALVVEPLPCLCAACRAPTVLACRHECMHPIGLPAITCIVLSMFHFRSLRRVEMCVCVCQGTSFPPHRVDHQRKELCEVECKLDDGELQGLVEFLLLEDEQDLSHKGRSEESDCCKLSLLGLYCTDTTAPTTAIFIAANATAHTHTEKTPACSLCLSSNSCRSSALSPTASLNKCSTHTI